MVQMVQICLDISWYILDISRLAAQDQNPAEIGHLAVKGCRQGLVWHITRENNVTHRKTCWTFSDVFGLFSVLYRTFSDVLSLSQFTRFALAVLLCCCALALPSLLDASFPYLSLLSCSWFLPLFRLLFFTFITFTSHVSFPGAKKDESWNKSWNKSWKELESWFSGPDLASVPEECPEILVKLMQTCWVGMRYIRYDAIWCDEGMVGMVWLETESPFGNVMRVSCQVLVISHLVLKGKQIASYW